MDLTISVACTDILDLTCDVLVLKYAQAFYGADALVASVLTPNRLETISPRPGKHTLLASQGKLNASEVLFLGVLPLHQFDYGQIREFSAYALQVLAREAPNAKHVAMTMHGVGYGLDERESFLSQLAGIFDALNANIAQPSLKRITFVERNHGRASRLQEILDEQLQMETVTGERKELATASPPSRIANAGLRSNEKPHIFVAMPFNEELEDVYIFGIQGPINSAGYLCERVDMAIFTGDILSRIKTRIETATLIVADLTGSNPNVYLEVGYAWGKDRPTLLLVKKSEELKFDVRGQRCIVYKNIADLAQKLEADLSALR